MLIQPETVSLRTVTLFRDLYGETPIAAKTGGGFWFTKIPTPTNAPSFFKDRWYLVVGASHFERRRELGRLVPCGEMLIEIES